MTTKEELREIGVAVRTMEWEDKSNNYSYPDRWVAKMPCGDGEYSLAGSSKRNAWQWFRNGYFVPGKRHEPMALEEAKAAAQADYERRILSAIEIKP